MATPGRKAPPHPSVRDDGAQARIDSDLLASAYFGNEPGVRAAILQGASVDTRHPETGVTALHIAAGTNNLSLARYLIEERGAQFGPDGFGRWPTAVAAACEASDELCDYIIEAEARYIENASDQNLTSDD